MKSKIKYLTIGAIVGILFTSTMPVIADTVEVLFNSVGLKVNGVQTSQIGESYTLQNGNTVPYTISYKDTTYLPVRKIGEIFGVDIDYDDSTKNVIVGNDISDNSKDDSKTVTLVDTVVLTDLTYEQFKSLLIFHREDGEKFTEKQKNSSFYHYYLTFTGNISYDEFMKQWEVFSKENNNEFLKKLCKEYSYLAPYNTVCINIEYNERYIINFTNWE